MIVCDCCDGCDGCGSLVLLWAATSAHHSNTRNYGVELPHEAIGTPEVSPSMLHSPIPSNCFVFVICFVISLVVCLFCDLLLLDLAFGVVGFVVTI